jgi:hypothetical protein
MRRLNRVRQKPIEQRQGVGIVHADKALDPDRVDVDRPPAGFAVGADERVNDALLDFLLSLFRQARQLPRAMARLVDVLRLEGVDLGPRPMDEEAKALARAVFGSLPKGL